MNNLIVLYKYSPDRLSGELPYTAVHAGKILRFRTSAEAREKAIALGYDGIQGTFDPKVLPKPFPQPLRREPS